MHKRDWQNFVHLHMVYVKFFRKGTKTANFALVCVENFEKIEISIFQHFSEIFIRAIISLES